MINSILRKNNVINGYIISFLIILIIPISIMGTFTYSFFARKIVNNSLQDSFQRLEQADNINDLQIISINNISYSLMQNNYIKNALYSNAADAYTYYLAIMELKKARASNLFLDNIFIYFTNDDIVISSDSEFSKDVFYKYMFNTGYGTPETTDNYLKSLDGLTVIGGKNNQNLCVQDENILLLYPQPRIGNESNWIFIFSINEEKVSQLFSSSMQRYDGSLTMYSKDDNVIMSLNNENIPPDVLQNLKNSQGQWTKTKIQNMEYFALYLKSSSKEDISYVSLIQASKILSLSTQIATAIAAVIMLSIVIGLTVAYFLARANYIGLKNLMDKLNLSKFDDSGHKNEYYRIERSIDSFLSDSANMKSRLASQHPIICANFLKKLLKGSFMKSDEFYTATKTFFKVTFEPPFCVLTFSVENNKSYNSETNPDSSYIPSAIINILEEVALTVGYGRAVILENDNIAIILSLKTEKQEDIRAMCEETRYFWAKYFSIEASSGVGGIYSSVFDISKSYIESNSALEYRMIFGKYQDIFFKDIVRNDSTKLPFIGLDQKKIISNLKKGNIRVIRQLLDKVMSRIQIEGISIDVARCTYFDMINTAIRSLGELDDMLYSEIMSQNDITYNLFESQTLQELYLVVLNFYENTCSNIASGIKKDLSERISEEVMTNFSNPDYSLTKIAEALSVSPTYLSHYFAENIGKNFVDYVHEKRLNVACDFLATTQMKIFEIAEKTGYTSSHTLIRSFKKYLNMTPNEYRLKNINSSQS